MAISIDGQANDGSPGEGDNVGSDIEAIDGTVHNDAFGGSASADNFEGNGGADEIHGAGGNDDLYGGGGDDRVFGDGGNDKVQGASGSDIVDGGAGLDQIYGDIASCSVFCTFDPDTVFCPRWRAGHRGLRWGSGRRGSRSARRRGFLRLGGPCERRARRRPRKGELRRLEEDGEGEPQGTLQLQLQAGAGLRGKAVFGKLAKKSFRVPGSGKVKLTVTLARKKLALLRRKGKIKTKVTVTLRNAAGATSKASKTVTFNGEGVPGDLTPRSRNLFLVAVGAIALHVVDDNFVQQQPGAI